MTGHPTLLVTRPEPEASATVAAAQAAGFEAVAAPLLRIRPLPVTPAVPGAPPEAILLTSARSAALLRAARPELPADLPVFAVGPATAAAARAAGFSRVAATDTDGQAALEAAVAAGHRRILHARGSDSRPLRPPAGIEIAPLVLYRAEPVRRLAAAARNALGKGAIALLFSPRTARLFRQRLGAAGLAPEAVAVVALSPAVATAAGPGWRALAVAGRPTTAEVLAAARRLWQGAQGGAHG